MQGLVYMLAKIDNYRTLKSRNMVGNLVEILKSGNLEIRKSGNLEIWKSGNMEIWKYGNLEIWKSGIPRGDEGGMCFRLYGVCQGVWNCGH